MLLCGGLRPLTSFPPFLLVSVMPGGLLAGGGASYTMAGENVSEINDPEINAPETNALEINAPETDALEINAPETNALEPGP